MRPKALKNRCRGKSPNGLDFWQLHMLTSKALLLLAFFWTCLLLPDLTKTDGKEKKKMVLCEMTIPVSQQYRELIELWVSELCIHGIMFSQTCSQGKGALFWILCLVSDQHPVPVLSFPTQVHFPGY